MNIKKLFYTMDTDAFESYIHNIKNDPGTISVLPGKYFLFPDKEINDSIIQLHRIHTEFDAVAHSFSDFSQKQIIQSYLIDEIQNTNEIENIHTTRHDIFSVMNHVKKRPSDHHINSVLNSYALLLKQNDQKLKELKDLREQYDLLMQDAFEDEEDKPDGKYFRSKSVSISDGLKTVYNGYYPEEKVIEGMKQFLSIYNNASMDIYLRLIISHFMLETIHPFYDGNGRLGRYLFSRELYRQERSYAAFLIASCINKQKSNYYKSFRETEDIHEYGCLNTYTDMFLKILSDGFSDEIMKLKEKESTLQNQINEIPDDIRKSERKILIVLLEASIFTFFGISIDEIIKQTSSSKRTVIYALNDLRKRNLLIETKFGRIIFHKAKL
ncbi:MAG: Fic family protein [Erysipelotrichaceae bacterium]|nr:Fic family protein [Erysipelotrichaceae bacterium]